MSFVFWVILLPLAAAQQPENLATIQTLIKQSKLDEADRQLQAILAKQPANSRAELLLGTVRLRQHKFDDAEKLFRQATQHDSKSLPACESLAELLRDEARIEEASDQYTACLKIAPGKPANLVELAVLQTRAAEYEKSLATAKLVPVTARPAKLLPVMATSYLALSRSDEAQQAIGAVLQRAEQDPDIVAQLAQGLLQLGAWKDAAEMLRVAQPHLKPTAALLTVVGETQFAAGEIEQSKQTVASALVTDPNNIEALKTAASLAAAQQDWATAEQILDRAMSVGPPRDDVLRQIVYLEIAKGDLRAAHEVAQRWQMLRPNDSEAALSFAVVMVGEEQWVQAKSLLTKVLAKHPDDKRALQARGVVAYSEGDLSNAKKYLTDSLGQGAADTNSYYFLGLVAKRDGDVALATQQLQKAVELNSANARAVGALGQMYAQQNELPKAQAALEEAIKLAPDDAQNHYELSRVYNKLGSKEEAKTQMDLYEKLRGRH